MSFRYSKALNRFKPSLRHAATLIATVALYTLPTSGKAATVVNGSALASPQYSLTFDEIVLPENTVLSNQYAAYGIGFSEFIYNGCRSCSPTRPDIGNFGQDNLDVWDASVSILFNGGATDATFRLIWNPPSPTHTISTLLSGVALETIVLTALDPLGTYGFVNTLFDEIRFNFSAAMLADDLAYNLSSPSAVPVPAALPLLGSVLGLGGLVGWFRRKRAVAA
jgi:hypothetical protein